MSSMYEEVSIFLKINPTPAGEVNMTNLKIVQWQAGFVALFVGVYLTHRSLEPKSGRCGTTLQISLKH
jgi:hypothetical protein